MPKSTSHQEKMYSLISTFESSGLSQTKFALEHGISMRQFRYWLNKYALKTKKIKSSTPSFIPVEIESLTTNSQEMNFKETNSSAIEIIMSNGTVVRIPMI